jgi:hypothetical protein
VAGQPETMGGTVSWTINYQNSARYTYFYYGPLNYVYPWSISAIFTKGTAYDSTTSDIYVSNNLKSWQRYAGITKSTKKNVADTAFFEDIFGTAYRYVALRRYNFAADTARLKELNLILKAVATK